MKFKSCALSFFLLILATPLFAQESADILNETNYNGLKFRSIGPAFTSGRIADIDIHPDNENIWYVAVGSGGVWKTKNAGVTWKPIFDNQSSYSIGDVTIDPHNPHTIWVGTGENVGGRHVGYGDGVYKSTDDGQTWENMGLKDSERISKIIIHPKNRNIIYVAAQGPLWDKGGQRGLYKSTDGGQTWNKILGGNEWTGVTDIVMDPRDPDLIYAATWQRQRTPYIYLGGGPGSGIHRTTDGGETWKELTHGIPNTNLGKIGLAISPQKPDIVYATITLNRREGGVFMSKNRGGTWKKMSDAVPGGTGPHYYQELYASPHKFGRIYLMDVRAKISDNNGKSFHPFEGRKKHVDNHAMAFRTDDPDYLLMGTDGGLYESFDHGTTWRHIDNMPITQYYKLSVDNAQPFYNIYGGTQDNGSHGGPSRTEYKSGIRNADWFKILGADGHDNAVEPGNPNIVYGEYQEGDLFRIDRKTGDPVFIQPQPDENEDYERFNWDTPIEVSPHKPTRIYTASHRVWKSEDRGNSWTPISGDLTLDQERLKLDVMGKQRSWDNPWDVRAMSDYNTITNLAISPLKEGLIYAGTDDGLLQVTENGGENWREIKLSEIDVVPAKAFINDIVASRHNPNTVFVAMDDHKNGDFNPYIIKSTDRGESWELISEDLPDRHLVWRLVQDDKKQGLMFAATEFGIFFTVDGGKEWIELKGGLPTIAFRDITIQREKNDLVAASFGRSFYILDNYTALRNVNAQTLNKDAHLFDTRTTYWYLEDDVVDSKGDSYYAGENPPFGAVFTYHLKEGFSTIEERRQKMENQLGDEEDVPFPGWDSLEAEMRQRKPKIQITIRDQEGTVVRKVDGPTTAGFHRVNWNLHYPDKDVVDLGKSGGWYTGGFLATPGTYTAALSKVKDGNITKLSGPITFEVVPLREGTLERASDKTIAQFRQELEQFQQEIGKTSNRLNKQIDRINAMRKALTRADQEAPDLLQQIHDTRSQLLEIKENMSGSEAKKDIGEHTTPTPSDRYYVGYRGLNSTYGPTPMHMQTVENGQSELSDIQKRLDKITQNVMPKLEQELEEIGAPPIEE